MTDEGGVFALTPGPVEAAHIRKLAVAGPGHAIALGPDGTARVIAWTAPDALADGGAHQAVWTWREYYGTFGHQSKHRLTAVWARRLAGIANRQILELADGSQNAAELRAWLRYPKPADHWFARLAHAVDVSGVRVPVPEGWPDPRNEIAVRSPVGGRYRSGYDLTFGDLDDLYRRLTERAETASQTETGAGFAAGRTVEDQDA